MSQIIFRAGYHVGEAAAEDDGEFLKNCFIKVPVVDLLTDFSNNKSILLGRTGSGKTAILNHIKENYDNVIEIKPEEVSFEFISNSNIIQFFEELGINLHIFYQMLWKHVFCREIIKKVYDVKNSANQNKFFRVVDEILLKDKRKQRALEYLNKWKEDFWIGADESLRIITNSLEDDLSASVKAKISVAEMSAEGARALTKSVRKEIVQRAKPVVNKVQIRDLNEVIELLSEAIADKSRRWFLIIDGLDEPWAEQNIQYNLIRALIESIRTFRKIDNLKIIIVLRDDLYEKVISKTKRAGFQSEKYEGIIAKVKWSPDEMRMLINKRIEYLFVRKYEKKNIVKLYDIIPRNIRKYDTFNYIIMRTLYRPRDVIAFINEILENAAGKKEIGYRNVRDAEFTYSRKRLTALEEEWSSMHPMLGKYVSFLANRKERIPFTDISVREFIEDMVLAIVEQSESTTDEITELAQEIMKKQTATRILNMSKEWVLCLYKVGAIGVKPELGSKFLFSHVDGHQLSRAQLSKDTILSVHPMLWRSLNITPNI